MQEQHVLERGICEQVAVKQSRSHIGVLTIIAKAPLPKDTPVLDVGGELYTEREYIQLMERDEQMDRIYSYPVGRADIRDVLGDKYTGPAL